MPSSNNQSILYRHVAAELRERIASGIYPPHSAIPSQSALVSAFGVSPITIRRAIRELTFEGLLYSHQGRGVFVADTRRIVRVLTDDVGASFGDEIRRAGFEPSVREISFGEFRPDPDLTLRLKARFGTRLYRHEKLILADQAPIALDTVHLPRRLGEQMRERLRNEFVFPLIAALNIELGRADFCFESALASDREAGLLGVSPRFPLIVARYILFDNGNAPLLEGYTSSRADRITFKLSIGSNRLLRTTKHAVVARGARRVIRK